MKIEQVAFHDTANFALMDALRYKEGHPEWFGDTVESTGIIADPQAPGGYRAIENVAQLFFNYSFIPGVEFECIHYVEGPNFLMTTPTGQMSHLGEHVASIEDVLPGFFMNGFRLVQEVVTQHHTSSRVDNNRRYHYAIMKRPETKFFWKLIARIDNFAEADRKTRLVLEKAK